MRARIAGETQIVVRWMIARDKLDVVRIAQRAGGLLTNEEELLRTCRELNTIGVVAEYDGRFDVGYMVYSLHRHGIEIRDMATDPIHRRCGVGSALIERLKARLIEQRRDHIAAIVEEHNLPGQLFLQSHGFNAIEIERGHFGGSDGYVMQYDVGR